MTRKMQRSIETYNRLHECSRQALSIEEANNEGCSFCDNEPTRKAFEDFHRDYTQFCEEQNTVDGEPFTQEPPTIQYYLKLHKATKKANRKLKIGVTAPPVMDFAMRGPAAPRSVQQPVKVRLEVPASKTPKLLAEVKPRSKPSMKLGQNFKEFVETEKSFAGKDLLFFHPRENSYEEEMARDPLAFAQRHAFPVRQKVIAKIKQWKQLMQGTDSADMKKATEITIRSLDSKDRPIGSIAFSFKSFDKCCTDEKAYVSLMCNFIKQ